MTEAVICTPPCARCASTTPTDLWRPDELQVTERLVAAYGQREVRVLDPAFGDTRKVKVLRIPMWVVRAESERGQRVGRDALACCMAPTVGILNSPLR